MAPEKKNAKSTKITKVTQKETVVAPVVAPVVTKGKKKVTKAAEPVVAAVVAPVVEPVVAPVVTKGKKKAIKAADPVAAPVAAPVVAPVVKKGKKVVKAAESVVEQTAGKKKATKKVTEAPVVSEVPVAKKAVRVRKAATKRPKVVKKKEITEEDEDSKKSGVRFFKIVDGEGRTGRFKGTKPKQAACKAFTAIVKTMGDKYVLNTTIPFTIVECTRNSKNKEYTYNGYKAELDVPHEVPIKKGEGTSAPIIYKYKNFIKKDKQVAPTVVA